MKEKSYILTRSDQGQNLVLFMVLLIVFLAIIAFAVDGGRVYIEQRRTQNAADNASLGSALALCRGVENYIAEGYTVADENGYDNDGTSNTVSINSPPVYGSSAGSSGAVEAIVQSEIPSTFANIIGVSSFDVSGRAVSTCEIGGAYAIFAGGEYCDKQIEWSGSDSLVIGDVHSNNSIHISGSGNVVQGNITWADPFDELNELSQADNTIPDPTQDGPLPYPVDYNWTDYSTGYFSFPGGIESFTDLGAHVQPDTENPNYDWVLDDGVYYTPGIIKLDFQRVRGNVTFVAGGFIDISGSDQYLTPFIDGLLAYSYGDPGSEDPDKRCTEPGVKIAGSNSLWEGVIYAPEAMIDMSGSENSTVSGSLIGHKIKMPGSVLGVEVIEDEGEPSISLIE